MKHPCRIIPPANAPRRRAFSLIELLTVVAIIGILAAIIVPVVSSVRKNVDTATCAARLREIYKGYQMYAAEHNGAIIISFRFKDLRDNPGSYPGMSSDYNLHWWQTLLKHGYLGAPDVPNIYWTPQAPNSSGLTWTNSNIRFYYKVLGCPTVQAYGLDQQREIDAGSGTRIPAGAGYMNYCINNEIANPNTDIASLNMTMDQIVQPSRAILGGDYKLERDDANAGNINLNASGYLPEAIHGDRANILFFDGHVEALNPLTEIPKSTDDRREYYIVWKGKYAD